MLEVNDLWVTYKSTNGAGTRAVRGVQFQVPDNTFVGLVGESGCGKSTLGFAISGLLDPKRNSIDGEITLDGQDLRNLTPEQLRQTRWTKLSVVLQGGMNAFNPVLKIKDQFMDVMRTHTHMNKREMTARTAEMLERVALDAKVMDAYPHELSGGMKQRAAIALSLVLNPRMVVLDEPTTALDVVVQRSIVTMLGTLQKELGFSALFISHDLGLVLEVAERVMVMYAGQIVENQPSSALLSEAKHPYTQALLGCYANPRAEHVELSGIPGAPPDLRSTLQGCPFAPRCVYKADICMTRTPLLRLHGKAHVACHRYTAEEATIIK